MGPLSPEAPVVEDVAWFRVQDSGAAGAVRRAATGLGAQLGLAERRVDELALLVVELVTNLHKHADEGQVLLRSLRGATQAGVEVVAVDAGPGMADEALSRLDGHSTAGTLGIGLGAIVRLATSSDLYSLPGRGTVMTAQVWNPGVRVAAPAEGLTRPISGEPVSGDAWAFRRRDRLQLMLSDGLGHGRLAASASRVAMDAFQAAPDGGPADLLEHLHRALRHTRGAAVAVAELDPAAGEVRFAGLGNIAGYVVPAADSSAWRPPGARGGAIAGERQSMVSMPGITGHQRRAVREFSYPLGGNDLVVLHSDGVSDRWRLSDYPGLAAHPPLVIAATLLRDAGVRRDDAGILVARAPT